MQSVVSRELRADRMFQGLDRPLRLPLGLKSCVSGATPLRPANRLSLDAVAREMRSRWLQRQHHPAQALFILDQHEDEGTVAVCGILQALMRLNG